jgi:hypothetical protein
VFGDGRETTHFHAYTLKQKNEKHFNLVLSINNGCVGNNLRKNAKVLQKIQPSPNLIEESMCFPCFLSKQTKGK